MFKTGSNCAGDTEHSLAQSQAGGDLPAYLDAKNPLHLQGRVGFQTFTINRGQASLNSKHTSQGKMGGSCMDGRVLSDRGDSE